MTVRITAATLIALAALVFAAPGAERNATEAAYPGPNGRISFVIGQVGGYSIHTMNPDGTDIAFVDFGAGPFLGLPVAAPVWSPDGSEIAYHAVSQPGPGIRVTSADGSESRVVPNTEDALFFATWSPDGSKLAFSEMVDSRLDIFTIATDGSNKTNITNTPGESEGYLEWSPNGQRIAFATGGSETQWDIKVVDVDGSNRRNVTDTPGASEIRPSWSPDGEHLIFERDTEESVHQVARVDADGQNYTIIGEGREPAYSPDGEKIVFSETIAISVMDADGGNRLVIKEVFGGNPDWGTHPVTTPADLIWGDNNCSGRVDPVDALLTMRFDADLATNTGDCPGFEDVIEVVGGIERRWGDIDCRDGVNVIDSLKLLQKDVGLAISQEAGCPPVESVLQAFS